ncbi:hypothetical protein [Sabulicella glaciei]|uniref:Calcineurin-like phosphoesterase domain-containing protein n=1 Tax=Sabulicella glaciei TaxID=2984948 RepID=A0ABT3NPY1_9PROT|nr:hypothetical protein [Roseococcus sp. MDT2-1-1]MCW8084211.1 hypothetical protein [Roseococcus sp. MDT2-1-1]
MNGFPVVAARGVLFIGDVHLWSRRPGRRLDEDYAACVLEKLRFALNAAASRDLLPVFLGDMFHAAREADDGLKARLLRLLLAQPRRAWSNVGNHDVSGLALAESDSLSLLLAAGALHAVPQGGAGVVVEGEGRRVGIGFTPHGVEIPDCVAGAFGETMPDATVWVTHHDLAFNSRYPGSTALKPIAGCRLALNGHMHVGCAPVEMGETTWMNPGALTRVSVTEAAHAPCVWELRFSDWGMRRIEVPHRRDAFDLTGKLVQPEAPRRDAAERDAFDSAFASLLESSMMDPVAADDGAFLREMIEARLAAGDVSPAARRIVLGLLEDAAGRGGSR